MSISWDEEQPVAVLAWLENKIELKGNLHVYTIDIPSNAFAADFRMEEKDLIICTNLTNSLADWGVTIVLGYILALSFDQMQWEKIPSQPVVELCHRQVCDALYEFNQEFAEAVDESSELLVAWIDHKQSNAQGVESASSLVEEMGYDLFRVRPSDDKFGAN
jgi:hypothetical protein